MRQRIGGLPWAQGIPIVAALALTSLFATGCARGRTDMMRPGQEPDALRRYQADLDEVLREHGQAPLGRLDCTEPIERVTVSGSFGSSCVGTLDDLCGRERLAEELRGRVERLEPFFDNDADRFIFFDQYVVKDGFVASYERCTPTACWEHGGERSCSTKDDVVIFRG